MKRLALISIVLMAAMLMVWLASYWRFVGWSRHDENWVFPGTGMRELHTTEQMCWLVNGRFEFVTSQFVSAVIPAGSSAATEPRHESNWIWQPAEPLRVRSWDRLWHVTQWNDWRLGDLGWYTTAGGASISRVVSLPLWTVILVIGSPCWLRLWTNAQSRRRRRRGQCVNCGYDRRGLVSEQACPECGKLAR